MKGFFLIFITLIPFLSINAQTKLPGKYRFHAENGEPGSLILNCDHTFLMEDTLIIRNDSSITSVVKGS